MTKLSYNLRLTITFSFGNVNFAQDIAIEFGVVFEL